QTLEAVDREEEALRKIAAIWPEYDFEQRLQEAGKAAQESQLALLDQDIQQLTSHLNSDIAQLESAIQQHNLHCDNLDTILFERDYENNHSLTTFSRVCHNRKEIDNIHNRQEQRARSEEHTSELQSRENLVCRLLLEKKNKQ